MRSVAAMSYIHPISDQSDLPSHEMANKFSLGIGDNLGKALIPPVQVFVATGR